MTFPFREEIREVEMKKAELYEEFDRITKRVSEVESGLTTKEGELEGITTEMSQKIQELQELNEMIQENDAKYRKVIKENRDALDRTMQELREKEEDYHSLLVEIDKLTRQKEEVQGSYNKVDREARTREETLKKLVANIEYSKSEIERMNESIIVLTEKEAAMVWLSVKKINLMML